MGEGTVRGGKVDGRKQAKRGKITRISRIKGTDYTEYGGGIVHLETLSMLWEIVFWHFVRLFAVRVIRVLNP
jgi:hypothetical protein